MDSYYTLNANAAAPSLKDLTSEGYPTDGNPSLGIPATRPGAAWFYSVNQEIKNAIEALGVKADKEKVNQLAQGLTDKFKKIERTYVDLYNAQNVDGQKTFIKTIIAKGGVKGYLDGNISGSSTSCTGNSATASWSTRAQRDNLSQIIDTTYIKNISASGTKITVTRGNNSQFTFYTQDSVGITKAQLLNLIYPVGAIFISVNATNPASFIGGHWEALEQGRVLIGAGSSYKAGSRGGEATHTLSVNEMPWHQHTGTTSSAPSSKRHIHGFGKYKWGHNNGTFSTIDPALTFDVYSESGGTGWNGSNNGGWNNKNNKMTQCNCITTFEKEIDDTNTNWHSHSFTTSGVGATHAHNNMQPYLVVYMWKRVA